MADFVTLTPPSSPADTWFKAIQTQFTLTHNFSMEFTIETTSSDPEWAVVLGYTSSTNYYLLGVDSDRNPFVLKVNGATSKILCELPIEVPLYGTVRISFRERRFREAEEDVWHCFGMWVNGAHIMSHAEPTSIVMENPLMGFAAWTDTPVTFDNIHIPQLTEFADWISIDPGEPPLRALERAIEGSYVKYFIRYNGTLRAWVPVETGSAFDYDVILGSKTKLDIRELKNHVRMLGAYVQSEYARSDLITRYGHRFTELSNPYLMTEQDCYRQAELSIKRMEETADTESIEVIYNPLLEVEDHVTTPTDRIIDNRSITISSPEATEGMELRKYTLGS